jgi:hypothetical protein
MAYKTLNLDLSKSPILKPIIYGRVGDTEMQTATVNVTNRDTPIDLTGFTITFEGITSGGKTKVFDTKGVKLTNATKGVFEYTFPNMAFAVAGNYEVAYFSITKSGKRDTTGEFDIIVANNADIDAEEAHTIITEYNRLVNELHAITDQYISDSDAKFSDINTKISALQTKITQFQTTVENTAGAAVATVNTASAEAVQRIESALTEFAAGDFYTQAETNTMLSKTFQDKGEISASGNLNTYQNTGFYSISARTPEALVGAPSGLSVNASGNVYAQLLVFKSTGVGPLKQLLVDNVSGAEYSRSYYPYAWTPWVKTITDSGNVPKTIIDTFDSNFAAYSGQAPLYYKRDGRVYLEGAISPTTLLAGSLTTTYTAFTLPAGCRPAVAVNQLCQGSSDRIWALTVNTNGIVTVGRQRTGATVQDYTVGSWLPFNISFRAAD